MQQSYLENSDRALREELWILLGTVEGSKY